MSNLQARDAICVHLAEYAALRAEILQVSQLQMLYMSLPAGILAIPHPLTAIWAKDWIVVLVLCLPSLLYCSADTHIQNLARYIQCYLRPALVRQMETEPEILQWESYIRDKYGSQLNRRGPFGNYAQFIQPLIVFVPAVYYFFHAILAQFGGAQSTVSPYALMAYTVDLFVLIVVAVYLARLKDRSLGSLGL